jgi:uncharacterized delta-60 repeat protein
MALSFLNRLVSRKNRRAKRNPYQLNRRPRLEGLENRVVLTAGALDPSFGAEGKVLTDFTLDFELHGYDSGRQVAIQQADGKIVLAGSSENFEVGASRAIAIARYNTDGSLDGSFGDEGRVRDQFAPFFQVGGMTLQADGKIVVVGYSMAEAGSTGSDFMLARYNPDGTPDTSFDDDGWLTRDFGADETGLSVAVQADGMLVVAGYSFSELMGTGNDFALARFNTDGSVDTEFGTSGLVTTDFGLGFNELAVSVVVQPDGNIVAAGEIFDGNDGDFALARYDSNGVLDVSFGEGGLVTTDFGSDSNEHAASMTLTAGGKIVVAGDSSAGGIDADFALARYNSDGSLDEDFGEGGKVLTDIDGTHNFANSVAVHPDGKIALAGYTRQDFAVARYNENGSLDTGFSGDGTVMTDFEGELDQASSVVFQADGKIVAAGTAFTGFINIDFALARYSVSGELDSSFDDDGRVITEFPVSFISLQDSGRQVAVQPDGKIIVAGTSLDLFIADAIALARYNPDGSLDATFGDNGKVWDTSLFSAEVTGMVLQSDGKIVVVGDALGESTFTVDFFVARYNSDGSVDESFGVGGYVTTDFGSTEFGTMDEASSVAIDPDGRIVVAGATLLDEFAPHDFALARYTSDGDLDADFGIGGLVTTDFFAADVAFSVALQSDGKIVAAGVTIDEFAGTSDFALARYDDSGALDAGFGVGGLVVTNISTLDSELAATLDIAQSVVIQPDGKIVAGGIAIETEDLADYALVRYDINGELDTTFDGDGIVTSDFGAVDWIFGLAVQPDGKIVAAGTSYQGETGFDFSLARYHADGALDASFGSGGWVTTDFGSPRDLGQGVALQADGKIVVAGVSEQPRTSSDFAVARYEGLFTGAVMETDTCDPTKTQLVIGGTRGDDKIKIVPAGKGEVEVRLNGKSLGTFDPTGRIIVLGHTGNDDIQLAGSIANSAWLYGDAGDDRLSGGAGDDVILGGDGDDLVHGAGGRDLLIGGLGGDRILGNGEDDILIAGTTDHDAAEAALCQIMDEWTRDDADYLVRVLHLSGLGTGHNGSVMLTDDTVHDDGQEDLLTGNSGSDWFFFNRDGDGQRRIKDEVTDMSKFEALFAKDIDFIQEP